jgi:hypothetical protein
MDIDSATWKTVGARKMGERSVSPPKLRSDDTMHHHKEKQIDDRKASDKGATIDITASLHAGSEVKCRNQQISSHNTMTSESSSTVGKQSAIQTDLNVPTNNGTYQLTFRWTPPSDFHKYHDNSTL